MTCSSYTLTLPFLDRQFQRPSNLRIILTVLQIQSITDSFQQPSFLAYRRLEAFIVGSVPYDIEIHYEYPLAIVLLSMTLKHVQPFHPTARGRSAAALVNQVWLIFWFLLYQYREVRIYKLVVFCSPSTTAWYIFIVNFVKCSLIEKKIRRKLEIKDKYTTKFSEVVSWLLEDEYVRLRIYDDKISLRFERTLHCLQREDFLFIFYSKTSRAIVDTVIEHCRPLTSNPTNVSKSFLLLCFHLILSTLAHRNNIF